MSGIDALGTEQTNIFQAGTKEGKFGNNPFLQLLVTQMQSQTPLDPVDNNAFMSQMSQLSTMEEQKEMNRNLLRLLEFQGALARLQGLSQGTEMIGREVDYVSGNTSKLQKGVVDSVRVDENGNIVVQIGGKGVGIESIVGVREAKKEQGDPDKTPEKDPTE